jgi:hypothetical protein
MFTAIDDGVLAFTGGSMADGIVAIYTYDQGMMTPVYDNSMPMPGETAYLDRMGAVRMRDGKFAFVAINDDFTTGGVFSDAGGELAPFMTYSTPIPGQDGTFVGLSYPSFDGDHVAAAGWGASPDMGIYTDYTGELAQVIAEPGQLFGKPFSGFGFGTNALERNKLAFWVRFADGEAIVLARYPAPLGDVDDDGDVDLADAALLSECFGGSFQPTTSSGCELADFNGDTDVDLGDYRILANCLNGPNQTPTCDD